MSTSEPLFPVRFTRRELMAAGLVTAAGVVVTNRLHGAEAPGAAPAGPAAPVKIGTGKFTYTLDENWGKLPAGMKYGLGCGIVVDGKDRVIVTSRSNNPCVAIFDAEGKLVETWAKDFGDKVGYTPEQVAATAHGIYWSQEGENEYLYFTENVAKNLGVRVYKTDLTGKVLYTIGRVEKESETSQKFTEWKSPTDVAVAANGDIYVVDGYGSQKVGRFDKNFKHLKTIGGKGTGRGQFNTCHGVWISTLKKDPEVYIADRANGRYEVYSPELEYKRTVAGDFVRNPCCFYQHAGHLYIPDIGGHLTILDEHDKPAAILGDGKAALAKKEDFEKANPDKFAKPHALTVDSKGNIYVLEWLPYGRVRKFAHTPA